MPQTDKSSAEYYKELPEIENKAIEWQSDPEKDTAGLMDAIRSGEVLLVARSKQLQIDAHIQILKDQRKDWQQKYVDTEYRYQILLRSFSHLINALSGIIVVIPRITLLIKELKLFDKDGISWNAAIKVCTDFMFSKGAYKKAMPLIDELKNGFNKEEFNKVEVENVFNILKENDIDVSRFNEPLIQIQQQING
jgi:hypothetical protein